MRAQPGTASLALRPRQRGLGGGWVHCGWLAGLQLELERWNRKLIEQAAMANRSDDPRTKSEILDYIDQLELEAENSDLQDALDSFADIVAGPPADDGDEDGEDDDSQYDSD